jgi:hypothetical protein
MKRYFAVCGGVIGWAVGIVVPAYGRWPAVYYDPAAGRWLIARTPGPLPIGYYGLCLYGAGFATVGAIGGALLARRGRDESYVLGAAWALTAILVAAAYYTFELWPG